MKLIVILLLSISFVFTAEGQTLKESTKALKKIKSLDQIEALKTQHPNWDISVDKTMLSDSSSFPNIINAKMGDIVLKQYNAEAPTYVIKVIDNKDEELCKVKYIYLDGSKLSNAE